MGNSLRKFLLSDQSGASAVEYAILAALIAGVIVATVAILGDQVAKLFSDFQADFASRR